MHRYDYLLQETLPACSGCARTSDFKVGMFDFAKLLKADRVRVSGAAQRVRAPVLIHWRLFVRVASGRAAAAAEGAARCGDEAGVRVSDACR